jgi:hypothetical protein
MWPVTSCLQNSPAAALPMDSAPKMTAAAMAVAGAPSRKNKFIVFTPNFLVALPDAQMWRGSRPRNRVQALLI